MCVGGKGGSRNRREGRGKGGDQRLETTENSVPGNRGEERYPIGKKQKGNRRGKREAGDSEGEAEPGSILRPGLSHQNSHPSAVPGPGPDPPGGKVQSPLVAQE